ncbi:MAG: hydrogenase expression/formation protein HypE [Planctomycetota bacterium]|nr:hydrogenase expression/formation protein HypE [Planctomycetota bacterium]
MRATKSDRILLAHGGGGQLSYEFIRRHILPRFKNDALAKLGDSAELNLDSKSVCFTTDSYVVKPLFFNGGDIGKLAVCGTVNDLAVAGSRPVALALSLIIEEGFEFELLEKILDSISRSAKENDVNIVTGDTKTVEAGAAEKIFINTAGVGVKLAGVDLGVEKIAVGDKIIINGTIGDHGLTIISQREGIKFQSKLKSDCAGLAGLTCKLLENVSGINPVRNKTPGVSASCLTRISNGVKFMRDPTRGGLAATLNEISRASALSIEINEADILVRPVVQAAADMLGFDVLTIANEGKFIAIISPESDKECLKICRNHPLGKDANIIGQVVETRDVPVVELITRIGGRRIVQMPYGRELPRIC